MRDAVRERRIPLLLTRFCQNQDFQDSAGARVLSESGFSGLRRRAFLSESGFSGLKDFQDSAGAHLFDGQAPVDIRIGRIRGYRERREFGGQNPENPLILKILILTKGARDCPLIPN